MNSSPKDCAFVLRVQDRSENQVTAVRIVKINKLDDAGPVIYNMESHLYGNHTSIYNYVRATSSAGDKTISHRITVHAWDDTDIDLSENSMIVKDQHNNPYALVSATRQGFYQGSPNFKMVYQKTISYDESHLTLGDNTITVTAQCKDLAVPANDSNEMSIDQVIYKEDQLAPTMLIGLYDDDLTSCMDTAWVNPLINVLDSENIDQPDLQTASNKLYLLLQCKDVFR